MNNDEITIISIAITTVTLGLMTGFLVYYTNYGSSKGGTKEFFRALFNFLIGAVFGVIILAAVLSIGTIAFVIWHELIIKFLAVKL